MNPLLLCNYYKTEKNMWTKKLVDKFIQDNPINTNGAISSYKTSKIETRDDGDVYHIVIYPLWSNNDSVVKDVFKTIQKVLDVGNVTIYSERDGIKIYFHESFCDPD